MKKIQFRLVQTILALVFFAGLIVIFRMGDGIQDFLVAKMTANSNSDNICLQKYTTEKMEIPPLPDEHREYTYEDMDIFINGKRYDFPLKYSELPDEFSASLMETDKNEDQYEFIVNLHYNNLTWATGYCYSDTAEYDPDNIVLNTLSFLGKRKSEYLPQVIIGGQDVYNADPIAVDRAFGYGVDEYYSTRYHIDAEVEGYEYLLRFFDEQIAIVSYREKDPLKSDLSISLIGDEYYLPEDYSPEADTVNNSMEYVSIPEKNEEMKLALENLTLQGQKIKLPCTVNSLLYALKDSNAYIEYSKSYADDMEGYNILKCSANIITDNGDYEVGFLITPGQSVGDAQVIILSTRYPDSGDMEISGIDVFDPSQSDECYGLEYNETEEHYAITGYTYNNVIIDGKMKVYYWPDNTDLINEDL